MTAPGAQMQAEMAEQPAVLAGWRRTAGVDAAALPVRGERVAAALGPEAGCRGAAILAREELS